MLSVDLRQVKKYVVENKTASKKVRAVTAYVLERKANVTMQRALTYMRREMVVRDRKFLENSLQTRSPRATVPTHAQYSLFFSQAFDRSTGFQELEYGGQPDADKTIALAARRGTVKPRVRPGARLRMSNRFLTPDDIKTWRGQSSPAAKAMSMLIMASRQRYRQPFVMTHHPGVKHPGLWTLEPGEHQYTDSMGRKRTGWGRLRILQRFDRKPSGVKRRPWMSVSLAKMTDQDVLTFWITGVERAGLGHFL